MLMLNFNEKLKNYENITTKYSLLT